LTDLHLAVRANDWALVQELVDAGATNFDARDSAQCTPLMVMAQQRDPPVHLALALAAKSNLSLFSKKRFFAWDYCKINNNYKLGTSLRELNAAEVSSADPGEHCEICGERLRPGRTKCAQVAEKVANGTETNPLLVQFFQDESEAASKFDTLPYHRINNMGKLRKELTESMCTVNTLRSVAVELAEAQAVSPEEAVPAREESIADAAAAAHAIVAGILERDDHPEAEPIVLGPTDMAAGLRGDEAVARHAAAEALEGFHIIDLCCGKAISAALLELMHPRVVVTCVDKQPPKFAPHFGPRVRYHILDLLSESFLPSMSAVIAEVGRPTLVCGMHLCGALSAKAIELLHVEPLVRALVLSPCCMPRLGGPFSSPAFFASPDQAEQYRRWFCRLGEAAAAAPGVKVTTRTVDEMLSERNHLIVAQRELRSAR